MHDVDGWTREAPPSPVSGAGHVTHHVAASGGAGFVGNALVGGVIGAGVDVASGAMMDLAPNPLNVVLDKVDDPVPPLAPTAAPPPPSPADPAK